MLKFLANLLPLLIKRPLYLLKHGEVVVSSEPIEGVSIKLGIPEDDKLWRGRMANGHEVGVCKWLRDNLKENDVFFDVGAHYGFFPSLLTAINPRVDIHAFEPGWQQGLYLKSNANRNSSVNNWKVSNKMVGDHDIGNMTSLDAYSKQAKAIPTIVQCDVDGGELYVVRGAAELIKKGKTSFLIELHPQHLKEDNSTIQDVMDFFTDGYSIKVLPNIREGSNEWLEDLTSIQEDDNPYMLATPLPR